jgi:hypothetical protein
MRQTGHGSKRWLSYGAGNRRDRASPGGLEDSQGENYAGLLVTSAIFTVVALHLLAAGLTALAAMPFFRGVLSLREASGTVVCLALGSVTYLCAGS